MLRTKSAITSAYKYTQLEARGAGKAQQFTNADVSYQKQKIVIDSLFGLVKNGIRSEARTFSSTGGGEYIFFGFTSQRPRVSLGYVVS